MSLFDSAENAVLDSLFGGGSPGSYDLGISTTQPTEAGGNITEPTADPAYARISVSNSGASFNPASGGVKTNLASFQFAQATIAWGTIGWWVLYNSSVPVLWGVLNPTRDIQIGDILRIPGGTPGQMQITCD